MRDDPRTEVIAYSYYEWDCPLCDAVTREDSDPSGDDVECIDCGVVFSCQGSR
jgi:hypothetical protein